jgi:hypothetical protein
MTLTMQSAWNEIAELGHRNVGEMAAAVAKGALMGARGNSGVILSQLWRGFSRGLHGAEILDGATLVKGFVEARDTAYKGVVRPVEGTILTVSKDIATAAESARRLHAHAAHQARVGVEFVLADPAVVHGVRFGHQPRQSAGEFVLFERLGHVEVEPRIVGSDRAAVHRMRHQRAQQVRGRVKAHVAVAPLPVEDRFDFLARLQGRLAGRRDVQDLAFITGLMSLMPAALGLPMTDILAHIAVASDARRALSRREGELGQLLELIERYDDNDMAGTAGLLGRRGNLTLNGLGALLADAIAWVQQLTAGE